MRPALRSVGAPALVLFFFAVLAFAVPTPAAAQIACGDTLGPGGSHVLGADLACSTGPALTLVGPVKVDLGNHRISCTSGGLTGVAVQGKGVSLRNGSIGGCSTGVSLGGAGRHKIAELAIAGAGGYGVLATSPGNRIADVDVADSGGSGGYGFWIAGEKHQIDRCSATNVADHGFALASGSGHRVRDIVVHSAGDDGVRVGAPQTRLERVRMSDVAGSGVYSSVDDLRMKDVAVAGSASAGFVLSGTRMRVQAAHVVDAARGFDIACTGDCQLKDVSARSNASQGFLVSGTGTRLTKARASLNAGAGIALSGTLQSTVQSSTSRGNGAFDASDAAVACGTNTWKSNSFGTTNDPCVQ